MTEQRDFPEGVSLTEALTTSIHNSDRQAQIEMEVAERRKIEEELRRKNERLELLATAAEHLLTTDDPETVVRGLFKKVAKHFGLDAYFNFMVSATGECLELDSCAGIPDAAVRDIVRLEFGQAVCGTVARERRRIVATDVQHSSDPKTDLIRTFGIQAYACHPLMIGDRLLGTLSFATKNRPDFTPDEIEFFGTICYYVAMAKERLRLLKETKDRAEQLSASYEREKVARISAEAANKLKDEFLATVSHELRNPLNSIVGTAYLLLHAPDTNAMSSVRQSAEVIHRNAIAQTQLINDLLDLSRLQRGCLDLDPHPIPIGLLVNDAVESIRAQAKAKQIQFNVEISNETLLADADPVRIQQIIWNLLSNAVKFTYHGGLIKISLTRDDGQIRLQVEDNGEGIDPEFLPHIFEVFRQGDARLTRKHSGLGIGLALVKQLAELQGGSIEAASGGAGCGSCFTLRLPLAYAEQQNKSAETGSEALGSELAGVRILVVDDMEDSLDLLSILLSGQGSKVTTATSGEEALKIALTQDFDLLLSDISMPGMDGYELVSRLKSSARTARIPAIAITGFNRAEDVRRAHNVGFVNHVPKPFDFDQLIKLAKNALTKNREIAV